LSNAAAPPTPLIRGTFSRNTLTSIFTTALDFITLTGLVELAGVDYVLATWIGTIAGSLSNFSINR
jgi:putative flippase GtrA